MQTNRIIQFVFVCALAGSWIGYGLLLMRQRHLLEISDPMGDTGISLGYGAMIAFGCPVILVFTILMMLGIWWLDKSMQTIEGRIPMPGSFSGKHRSPQ